MIFTNIDNSALDIIGRESASVRGVDVEESNLDYEEYDKAIEANERYDGHHMVIYIFISIFLFQLMCFNFLKRAEVIKNF